MSRIFDMLTRTKERAYAGRVKNPMIGGCSRFVPNIICTVLNHSMR